MARRVQDALIGTREARRKLKPRGKPYFRTIESGLHLGYRKLRNGAAGTWVERQYLGGGSYQAEGIGAADDLSDADGVAILDFWQAQTAARERMSARRLFPFERVLDAADGVLNLAFYLVGLALRFQLGVTDGLADRLLDCAFDFLRRSGDSILVHNSLLEYQSP